MKEKFEQVAQWIIRSERTVVFVGAGLSTESGIPDFRSPGGVWDRYNPEDFYFQNFISSEVSREKYWKMSSEMYEPMKKAQPNLAHLAIAEMERVGKLDCVITQNIDGLHFKAGNSEGKVIQLHGTAMSVSCLHCGKKFDRDQIQERLRKGLKVPYCEDCRGPLKPDTISFGQPMPEKETEEAYRRSSAVTSSSSSVRLSSFSPRRLCLWLQKGMGRDWSSSIGTRLPAMRWQISSSTVRQVRPWPAFWKM